jgi:hypothetical protein
MNPRYLLKLYPRAWRERYGEEFLALLDDVGLHWWDVPDVVRAALNERVRDAGRRAFGDLSERAFLRWRRFGLFAAWTAVAGGVAAGAWATGTWLREAGAQVPDTVRWGSVVVFTLGWFRFGATLLLRARLQSRGDRIPASLGIGAAEAVIWTVVALAHFTLQQAVEPSSGHLLLRVPAFIWLVGALTRRQMLDDARLHDLVWRAGSRGVLFDGPVGSVVAGEGRS